MSTLERLSLLGILISLCTLFPEPDYLRFAVAVSDYNMGFSFMTGRALCFTHTGNPCSF
jgi:hypothetical protein